MTNPEFSDGFDTKVAAYATQATFGEPVAKVDFTFDEYEKSFFLTEAQKELVVDYYSGKNVYGLSFEEKEQMREILDSLVETYVQDEQVEDMEGKEAGPLSVIHSFYALPEELLWIVYEQVTFGKCECDSCIEGTVALVTPAKHDELYTRVRNPFRGPGRTRVLRLNAEGDKVELLSDYPIGSYMIRYVKEPTPIILADLPDGLSIEGETDEQTCLLPDIVHSKVLDLAVTLAIQSRIPGESIKKAAKQQTTT